jgi:hypothetical protein
VVSWRDGAALREEGSDISDLVPLALRKQVGEQVVGGEYPMCGEHDVMQCSISGIFAQGIHDGSKMEAVFRAWYTAVLDVWK